MQNPGQLQWLRGLSDPSGCGASQERHNRKPSKVSQRLYVPACNAHCPLHTALVSLDESRRAGRRCSFLFSVSAGLTEAPVRDFLILRHISGFSSGLLGHVSPGLLCLCLHVSGVPWGFCHLWSSSNWDQLVHIAYASAYALPTDPF